MGGRVVADVCRWVGVRRSYRAVGGGRGGLVDRGEVVCAGHCDGVDLVVWLFVGLWYCAVLK